MISIGEPMTRTKRIRGERVERINRPPRIPGLIKFHSDFSNYPVAARHRVTRFPRWTDQPARHYRNTTRVTVEFVIPCTFSAAIPVRRTSFLIALRPQSVFHAVPASTRPSLRELSSSAPPLSFPSFQLFSNFSKKNSGAPRTWAKLPSMAEERMSRFRDEWILVEGMRDRFDWEYWENLMESDWIFFFEYFFLSRKLPPVNLSPISF